VVEHHPTIENEANQPMIKEESKPELNEVKVVNSVNQILSVPAKVKDFIEFQEPVKLEATVPKRTSKFFDK